VLDPNSNYGGKHLTSHKPHRRTISIKYGRLVAT